MTLAIALFQVSYSFAQPKYAPAEQGASFDGYDLVSYYLGEGPTLGKKTYQSSYDGLTLYFASQKNKQIFDKDPERYMPAYGGYCATAVSSKKFIKPNYKIYSLEDDKLMFFEVKGFFNGKTHWEKNPQINEIMADKHYKEHLAKE